jgi:hypothetical protein
VSGVGGNGLSGAAGGRREHPVGYLKEQPELPSERGVGVVGGSLGRVVFPVARRGLASHTGLIWRLSGWVFGVGPVGCGLVVG